jgi:hypothetical protein
MNIKQNVRLHNKFEITVCDAKTGEEKQKAYAYNVILDNFFKLRLRYLDGDNQPGYTNSMSYIGVGTGSGTPAITDTSLFTPLLHRSADLVETHYEYPTSYITRQIKINADEYNGSVFTEVAMECVYYVGLWSTAVYLPCTHAMIQDSEGNPIAITKTDVDVVYISATFYCTFSQTGFGDNGVYPLPQNNILVKYLLLGNTELVVRSHRFPIGSASDLVNDYEFTKSFTFGNCTGDFDTKTLDFPVLTILDSEFNGHIVKNLGITGIGVFQFPDPSVFPDYEINHLVLGEGDGETTEFNIKCPLIKDGTVHIFVADRELSASDFEADYESNCIDKLENYYTAAMKCDGVHIKIGDTATRAPSTSYQYRDPVYWGVSPTSGYVFPSMCYVSQANPIFIDFSEPKECNRLKIHNNPLSATNLSRLVIECSDDNETWAPVEYTVDDETFSSSIHYYTFSFPLTTARYWRAYVTSYNWPYYYYYPSTSMGTRDGTTHIKSSLFLGRTVPGLKLNTPPQAGETIEASFKLNVPFKTENNILRMTCSAVLQRG